MKPRVACLQARKIPDDRVLSPRCIVQPHRHHDLIPEKP